MIDGHREANMARRHRVLVIGVGSIGERNLRCFQATGRAEMSLVEVQSELRQTIAGRYQIRGAWDSVEAALAERPDVAVICTPAPFHVPLGLQLAEAGVHLLIEKPLGTSQDGVTKLCEMVAQRGLVAGVGYTMRHHPALVALRQALVDERWGRPLELVAVTGQNFPYYRPAYRTIYYRDRATGGGAIQDALTHVINAGEWLVGPIDRLVADAAHLALDGVEVEDTVHLLARHGNVLASYALNQHQPPNEFTISVICERGMARLETHRNRWRWMVQPGDAWHDETLPPIERDSLYIDQAHAFLDAVEGHAPPRCTLLEGWQTLKVNLAALASLESQSWQSIAR